MKQNFILKKITVLIFVYFYSTILFAQENQNSLQKEAYSYEELKSELIKNDNDYVGVKIKDKVALFSRTGESLSKKIDLIV